MKIPKVSILMSVYNGEKFLREAVDSMLCQSFEDFEFIIINDGSTDKTWEILESYNDLRIHLIHQDNMGLTRALNKGIDLAKGEYIARMDGDDISEPERLTKQVDWMESHSNYCAVATKVSCIGENGENKADWSSDQSTTTSDEMRRTLPRVNCIAHPSVMFRTAIVQKYQYNSLQKHSQDYDLWLRIYSDGLKIGKIDENLLKLRLHSASITSTTVQNFRELKMINVKKIYLHSKIFKIKRVNWFDFLVLIELVREMVSFAVNKRKVTE